LKTKIFLLLLTLSSLATFSQKQWTLKECVDEALAKNITIQQNRLSVELSKKDTEIAKGNFLPNLNAGTSGSLNFGTGFDPVSQDRVNTSFFGGSMNLSSGITVFNGFRNLNTYKQAKLGVEASILDLKNIENDISLFVVNGFLNILFAKENLAAAKVQYEISRKQVEAAQERFEAGTIPKGDLLNNQSTTATDLQNVVTQQNILDTAILNLAQALQVPSETFDIASIDVGTPSASLFYKTSSEVYNKSLERMPEIARAKLAIENEDLNIEISKSSFLPTLSVSAGLSTNYGFNLNLPDGISNPEFSNQLSDNLGYGFGFNLSIPIFNRFQTKNRVAQSIINKEVSQLALENEKLQLEQTIQQAFLDVKTALKSYEASKASLAAQKEAFKNAQESYNYGTLSLFDFDLVRTRFVNAQATMIAAKYDYVFKTKVLQFYSGDLKLD
jgi:outer membrane protein